LIIATFSVRKESLSVVEGYARLEALLQALNMAAPKLTWHRLARSVKEGARGWINFLNKDTYLRQAARDVGDDDDIGPLSQRGFAADVTTASSEAVWNQGEHIMLKFSPRTGIVQIQMFESKPGCEWTYEIVRDVFLVTCRTVDVLFAKCDVDAPDPSKKGVRPAIYSFDKRVFPHREFLGWIGFVKKEIEMSEIPEADERILVREKGGTMIVTVADRFDVHNPAHIEKAHRVEMRLVDLDALPVIDPRFL
jgi:hypothetical protein